MRYWPNCFSCCSDTGVPFINAFDLPSREMTRRTKQLSSSSSSNSCSSSQASAALWPFRLKWATISALGASLRTAPASARSPRQRLSASMAIDLPAPVSPVMAVIPDSRLTDNCLTTAKFLIDRLTSMCSPQYVYTVCVNIYSILAV